jgi:hypothetical protein
VIKKRVNPYSVAVIASIAVEAAIHNSSGTGNAKRKHFVRFLYLGKR